MLANDMYIILGPPLVLLLAFICLRVTYACIANGVGQDRKTV